MADLLTPQQRLDIKAALKDVTDTFMKTPVTIKIKGESVDQWNEDRADQVNTDHIINGLLEYEENIDDELVETRDGALIKQLVKVTFNLEDVAAAGCINGQDKPIFNTATDYFTANGDLYKMMFVGLDGPMDKRNILVVIKGKIQEKAT